MAESCKNLGCEGLVDAQWRKAERYGVPLRAVRGWGRRRAERYGGGLCGGGALRNGRAGFRPPARNVCMQMSGSATRRVVAVYSFLTSAYQPPACSSRPYRRPTSACGSAR